MNHPLLRAEHISKTYYAYNKAIKEALHDVSLTLFKGEVLGLLGVNGAGKTTLSTLLATLHPPSSGDIIWKEKSVYEDLLSYRKILGFCPQNPNIEKSLTIEENLVFAGRCYGLSKSNAFHRKDILRYGLTVPGSKMR